MAIKLKKKSKDAEILKKKKKKLGEKAEKETKTLKKSKSKDKEVTKKKKKKVREVEDIRPIKEKVKKGDLIERLMDGADIDKKTAKAVVEVLEKTMKGCLVKKSCGEFNFQGLFKLTLKDVPAKKGGKKAINRFTGEEYITKDKPASVKIRARPLNKLKKAVIPE